MMQEGQNYPTVEVHQSDEATMIYFTQGLSAQIGTTSKLAVPLLERHVKALDAILEFKWARTKTAIQEQKIIQRQALQKPNHPAKTT